MVRRPRQGSRVGRRPARRRSGLLDLDHFRSMQAEPFELSIPGSRGSAAAIRDLAPLEVWRSARLHPAGKTPALRACQRSGRGRTRGEGLRDAFDQEIIEAERPPRSRHAELHQLDGVEVLHAAADALGRVEQHAGLRAVGIAQHADADPVDHEIGSRRRRSRTCRCRRSACPRPRPPDGRAARVPRRAWPTAARCSCRRRP
jgi:hypothetical protein